MTVESDKDMHEYELKLFFGGRIFEWGSKKMRTLNPTVVSLDEKEKNHERANRQDENQIPRHEMEPNYHTATIQRVGHIEPLPGD